MIARRDHAEKMRGVMYPCDHCGGDILGYPADKPPFECADPACPGAPPTPSSQPRDENPGDVLGAVLARTAATFDVCAGRSKTMSDGEEHVWDIMETRARVGRDDIMVIADAFEELRRLRSEPRVDVEALRAILDDEERASDPTKTSGPRMAEAAQRARRLRAALGACDRHPTVICTYLW